MNVSSSAIADAMVTMLSAGSCIGPNAVSKAGYEKLESTASAAAMVKWRDLVSEPSTFGLSNYTDRWEFEIKCFIRNTGDPYLASNRVWDVTDRVIACMRADGTIQGTVDYIRRISGTNDPEQLLSINGATWLPFSIRISAVGL